MKTFVIQLEDTSETIELPLDIDSWDKAIEYIKHHFSDRNVRLIEKRWQCVSSTPIMIITPL